MVDGMLEGSCLVSFVLYRNGGQQSVVRGDKDTHCTNCECASG